MAASSRGGPAPPLALASVFDADGGVLAQTDGEGRFTLTLSAGPHPLTVGASGHQKLVVTETLAAGTKLEVRYRLERNELTFETVVRARHDEGPSRIELSRVELQEVAGTQGDPFRVTMLLPGVAAIASGLSYPVVRGSQPAATGFFLDGVRLPQHAGGELRRLPGPPCDQLSGVHQPRRVLHHRHAPERGQVVGQLE